MASKVPGVLPLLGPRMLACVTDAATAQAVRDLAATRGWVNVEIIDGGLAAAQAQLEQSPPPNLLVVDIDDVDDPVERLYALAGVSPPEMSVLAVGQGNDLALYRKLIDLGVTDYLDKPVTLPMLERTLRKEQRPSAGGKNGERPPAHLMTLIGARGGVGTTTVAAGVAWCLAHLHDRTVSLVDIDLHFGNLALSFDLVPGSGLREALEHPTRIDSRLLGSAALSESENLRVLAAEEPLIDQAKVATGAADAVLTVLRADCDFILVDLPRHLDDVARRLITLSTTLAIVTDLSLAAARDTLRLIELVKAMAPTARLMIIGNHVGAAHRGEVGKAEFERVIGTPIDHLIPFDGAASLTTASSGTALPAALRNSKAAAALRGVAAQLYGGGRTAARRKMGPVRLPGWLKRSA